MKKIVIVTSGQPCGNPRMVKEAITLSKALYDVKVIYCPMSIWGDNFDQSLFSDNPQISWIRVGAHPVNDRLGYIYARFRNLFWEILYVLFGNVFNSALKSSVLFSQELEKEAVKHKADLYIGHNLGSIYAIIKAAKKHNAKSSFDFEDFHRGEDLENSFHWRRIKQIEDQFVTKLEWATGASPLISNEYKLYYPNITIQTILNVFPIQIIDNYISSKKERLSLFWFSQTIGKGRGLENLIRATAHVKPQPRLTLLGNCSIAIKEEFLTVALDVGYDINLLSFTSVVSEAELINEASKHHIGICSEDPITLNRDLCLTNKIFTYMLGRNALLLSSTKAQRLFLEKNKDIGVLFNLKEVKELSKLIQNYQDNRELLDYHRLESFRKANEYYNWEIESVKLTFYYKNMLLS